MFIGSYGLANFNLNQGILTVRYCGSMGNNMEHIKECCLGFFGFDIYSRFKKITETGSADYLYTATFDMGTV